MLLILISFSRLIGPLDFHLYWPPSFHITMSHCWLKIALATFNHNHVCFSLLVTTGNRIEPAVGQPTNSFRGQLDSCKVYRQLYSPAGGCPAAMATKVATGQRVGLSGPAQRSAVHRPTPRQFQGKLKDIGLQLRLSSTWIKHALLNKNNTSH